jgi:ABC-2 type transport system permease protein
MRCELLPVIKKEMRSYFNSPIAYIIVVTFLVFCAVFTFFLQTFFANDAASLRDFFGIVPMVFVVVVPALTMRSWAEEKKQGTLELLLTLPYREASLAAGKFLAAFCLLGIMCALTLPIPLLLGMFGDFDWGEILAQYLGVILVGAAGLSVGLFVSSLATNQVSSFLASLFILLAFTMVSQVNSLVVLPSWAANAANSLSFGYHFWNFQKGLLDTRDLFFYLVVCGLFLYLNVKALSFRRW